MLLADAHTTRTLSVVREVWFFVLFCCVVPLFLLDQSAVSSAVVML